ncbi:MAG: aspartate--ammonia ligase [Clostridia bacterium]
MKIIPEDYAPIMQVRDTERAIKLVKDYFQANFAKKLNLSRVSAPIFVANNEGLNDNLSGKEKAVSFTITAIDDLPCEIVHSLAKWKRKALGAYKFDIGEGLYTDMNAIRRQEDVLDNIHSVYVDQWDWEKVITKEQRTTAYLKAIVDDIYDVIYKTSVQITKEFTFLKSFLPSSIFFISAQELEDMYPDNTSKEREDLICKLKGAVFISNIGCALKSGQKHDMRAPDYDDWALNGDILVWYPILNRAVELSSMGIRVDKNSLKSQLKKAGITDFTNYHLAIFDDKFPLTVGGGIGQSRLCMLMLQKAHIGEVQASIWPPETVKECSEKGIVLL